MAMFAVENIVSNLPVDGATTAVLKRPRFFSQLLVQSEDFFFEQLEPNIFTSSHCHTVTALFNVCVL